MSRKQAFIYIFLKGTVFVYSSIAYPEEIDLTDLSIEQLMQSQVSSVARTDQKFSDAAAAVFVVTQDDIQRSGVTHIADVLRIVPGLQVARISADQWAVTSRGFNGRYANKLLVLLDGRNIYSPTFAGVRWENLDLVLNDIERIEVIRGPGASVWGDNAVNGVINIITKHTEDTQQGIVSVVAGNKERAIVELRYGDQIDNNAHYRVFGKFLYRDEMLDLQGNNAKDDWVQGRAGFRVDWNSNIGDRLMIEGDGYVSKVQDSFLFPNDNQSGAARPSPEDNSGANILARWEHDISVASKTRTQFFYEYFDVENSNFGSEQSHTFDFDFQHDLAVLNNNYLNWGLGYRLVVDSFFDSRYATTDQTEEYLHRVNAFVQDKIVLFGDKLHLTLGTKIEYYTLSGWNYQPSVRLLWKFQSNHRLWASFSRATRSPSRGETTLGLRPLAAPSPIPLNIVGVANPNLDEERVLSYELGYRGWWGNRYSLDLAFFYNDYEDLVTGTLGQIDFVNGQIPVSLVNGATAKTWGIEAATDWRPIDLLRIQMSYSFLKVNYRDSSNSSRTVRPRTDPVNQFSFRGSYDVSSNVTFDATVRYVDSISSLDTLLSPPRRVDNYVGLDLRIAWQPIKNIELSIVGQNINKSAHQEYVKELFAYPRQLERSFYGKVQWSFN